MAKRPTLDTRLLNSRDADAYIKIRREMLVQSPLSFMTAPEEFEANIEDTVSRLSKPEHAIVGAFHEGRLRASAGVGRVARVKGRHRANIWGVYVGPELRGQGVGKQIMQLAIDTARSWEGVRVISLSYRAAGEHAGELYASLGFVAWGTEPDAMWVDGQGHDEIYMQLSLNTPDSQSPKS